MNNLIIIVWIIGNNYYYYDHFDVNKNCIINELHLCTSTFAFLHQAMSYWILDIGVSIGIGYPILDYKNIGIE